MCLCGRLVHVVSLCVIDNISECFPSTKDFGEISPSHVEPAIIVSVFPFLKAAFMMCSVLLEVSTIPVPPVPTWILDQCYWFKTGLLWSAAQKWASINVFSCPLFLPQWPRFDWLTDKGSYNTWLSERGVTIMLWSHSSTPSSAPEKFGWSRLKMDRNWPWNFQNTSLIWAPDAVIEPERILSSCPQGPASSLTSDVPSRN